jgi:transcriptional regulator with XRE-family HTH domain
VLSNLPDDPWLLQQRERVGRCIQQARLHHNLTQDAVYLAVPLNRSYYQDIEAGRANPSLDTLNGIARAIGVQLADLVR